ncbi:hypothetical protein [Pseudomonas aeruginosa]|uniref:hypothetical protein n=1 Tax=Pseudomonas aeruginosa TaxID=287 RepID=UPI001CD32E6B|nr:hypothetical protein [Pseudomonas aeruginosa]HCF6146632.1 hypothetical protein [Pseudomonas aeruginosa]HCT7936410.1 hypothetical protein [Pseudomonas aeruginosa]
MRLVPYTSSELWVKDELDRLLWIELAKRKLRHVEGDVYRELVSLRGEIERFFAEEGADLDEPLDYEADVLFDAVQFDYELAANSLAPEHSAFLAQAMDLFGHRAWLIQENMKYLRGFRMADMAVETDLQLLHGWWTFISSKKGRDALNAQGLYSSMGEEREVEVEDLWAAGEEGTPPVVRKVRLISSYGIPVRIPRKVPNRPVIAVTTEDHQVTVDGQELEDKLFLAIDLSRPLPPMREIERALKREHAAVESRRYWQNLESGIITDEMLARLDNRKHTKESMEKNLQDFARLHTTPPEEHKLMVGLTSPATFILGLYSWDLVSTGLTDAQACRQAAADLVGNEGEKIYSQKKAVDNLRRVVRPIIDAYEPTQLPWID